MSIIFILLQLLITYKVAQSQTCGRSENATRIVGGQTSRALAWPWMALLNIRSQRNGAIVMARCGASLISDNWVLTAAHCVSDSSGLKIMSIEVVLGEYDTTRREGTEVRLHGSQVVLNSYNPSTNANDIALIKLNRKLDFKGAHRYLQPICLPTSRVKADPEKCYATGWGSTSSGGKAATTLQQVRLPVLEPELCARIWEPMFSAERQICAGYREGGKDTCQGDSGGPLNCQLPNNIWVLQGITSYGQGCAQPMRPGVYTRVEAYVPWIERVTKIQF